MYPEISQHKIALALSRKYINSTLWIGNWLSIGLKTFLPIPGQPWPIPIFEVIHLKHIDIAGLILFDMDHGCMGEQNCFADLQLIYPCLNILSMI